MKKGIMWNQLIWWIIALIILAVLFYPSTAWGKNTWDKASKLFSWGDSDDNDDPDKVEYYDTFNQALRNQDIIRDSDFTIDEITNIINNLKFEQKLEATTYDVYLLSSVHAGKTIYLMYYPDSEGISVFQGSRVAEDDDKIYSYEESLDRGVLMSRSPIDLVEVIDWWPDRTYRLSPLTRADHQYSIDKGYPLPSTLRDAVVSKTGEAK